ncbi:MAG: hypothetical protein KTR13_07635 [Saprospiraceae bacterium]|nr:hypothetical protein [Saprospiraceae bacterium]
MMPLFRFLFYSGFLALLFSSCSPSIYQLHQSDFVHQLEGETLYIPLVDRSADIELLVKYGEDKKAARWARQDSVENSHRRIAFEKGYSFSEVVFISENELPNTNSLRFVMELEEVGRDNDQSVIAAVIAISDNRDWTIKGSPYSTFSASGYLRLAKNIQNAFEQAASRKVAD